MMLYNSRESIISTYVLVIEASKLKTYAKGHKWIGTIKRFNDIITKSLHQHDREINNIKYYISIALYELSVSLSFIFNFRINLMINAKMTASC